MSSTDIRTKEDFKNTFGRSPIKIDEQLIMPNDELDDEDTQFSHQLRKEDIVNYHNSLHRKSKQRLLFNDYSKLLKNPELRDNLEKIPLNALTKPVIKNDKRGGRKRTRVFRKKSNKRRTSKSSRRNSRKYK